MNHVFIVATIVFVVAGCRHAPAARHTLPAAPVAAPATPTSHATESAPEVAPPPVLVLQEAATVRFAFDSARLPRVEGTIPLPSADGFGLVVVVGHADIQGPAAYNLALSKRRALAIVTALVDSGIQADNIKWIAKGETEPLCRELTRACHRKNRRVVVYTNQEVVAP